MKKHRFEFLLAAALAVLFAVFWFWQTPGAAAKLTRRDVDTYIRELDLHLTMRAADKAEALARLRAWGEADDGKPVYMLNVMRYFDRLQEIPGGATLHGTPIEANAHYESVVLPMLARLGGYALVGGEVAGVRGTDRRGHSNLLLFDPAADDWNRVLVVRYPSRRAFFELITDPDYLEVMPYKLAALQVALVPVSAEAVVPDLRWIAGFACAVLFLLSGWLRASRRAYAAAPSSSGARTSD